MLPQLTPLAETRAVKDIVAASEARLRREAEQEKYQIAHNMMRRIDDDQFIAETTGLDLNTVQRLRAERG